MGKLPGAYSNTNLCLLTAVQGKPWLNSNGIVFNAVIILLIVTVSYVSTRVVLGIAIMLQAIIVMAGLYHARILTWSFLPLDTTAAPDRHSSVQLPYLFS